MSENTIICLGYAAVLLAFAFFIWRVCRDPRPKARDVIAAARADVARHDVGPDALRLLEDLDAHLNTYFASVNELYERLGPPPGLDPMGRARLMDAIREDQQREEA